MRAFASRLLLLVPVCALMVGCEPQADRPPAEVLAQGRRHLGQSRPSPRRPG